MNIKELKRGTPEYDSAVWESFTMNTPQDEIAMTPDAESANQVARGMIRMAVETMGRPDTNLILDNLGGRRAVMQALTRVIEQAI